MQEKGKMPVEGVMGQFEFWLFVSRSRKLKLTHHRERRARGNLRPAYAMNLLRRGRPAYAMNPPRRAGPAKAKTNLPL